MCECVSIARSLHGKKSEQNGATRKNKPKHTIDKRLRDISVCKHNFFFCFHFSMRGWEWSPETKCGVGFARVVFFLINFISVFLLQNDKFVRVGFFLWFCFSFIRKESIFRVLLFNRKEIYVFAIILSSLRTRQPKKNVKTHSVEMKTEIIWKKIINHPCLAFNKRF